MDLRECLIRNPAILLDNKSLENALNDIYLNHKGKVRHMLTAYYQLNFQEIILSNSFPSDLETRSIQQLTKVYDIPREKAIWVVREWKNVLCDDLSRKLTEAVSRYEQTKQLNRSLSPDSEQSSQTKEEVIKQIVENSMLRATFEMKQGNWAMAENLYDDILNLDIKNQEAWLGKLLCHRKVKTLEELSSKAILLDDDTDYQQALKFADDELASKLRNCAQSIRGNLISEAFNKATQALQKSNWNESEKHFCEVIRLDNSRSDAWLGKLFCHFKVRSIDELRTLPSAFENDPLFQETVLRVDNSTAQLLKSCAKENKDYIVQRAEEREQQRLQAEARKKAETKRKLKIRIVSIASGIILAGLTVLYFTVLAPLIKYHSALRQMDEGNYETAISMFGEMNGYNDTESRIQQAKANQLFDQGDIAAAHIIYAGLDAKYNTHAKDYQRIYSQAETYYSEGKLQESFDMFYSLGEYQDSPEKTKVVGMALAESLFEKSDYAGAAVVYEKLGMVDSTLKAKYNHANKLEQTGEYLSASALWLSIPDYSDSRKRNYQMAQSIKDTDPVTAVAILKNDIEYDGAKQALYTIAADSIKAQRFDLSISIYETLSEYKDSKNLLVDSKYKYALWYKEQGKYSEAINLLESTTGYKDSDNQIKDCNYLIAEGLYAEEKYTEALVIYSLLDNYIDSREKANSCNYHIASDYKHDKEYIEARTIFLGLGTYMDSPDQANQCGYIQAKSYMTEEKYAEASALFRELGNYEDCGDLANECDYLRAGELIEAGQLADADLLLTQLGDYKDSATLLAQTRLRKAKEYEESGDYSHALEMYIALGEYEGAPEKVLEMRYKLGDKEYSAGNAEKALSYLEQALTYSETKTLILKIATNSVKSKDYGIAERAYLLLGTDNAALKGLYDLGTIYQQQGKDDDAIRLFSEAGSYSDAAQRKQQIENKAKVEKMTKKAVFSVGNTVIFGQYEQDNNTRNGKEPIEWIIIDQKGSNVLLVSKYALDVQKYNNSKKDVTWATCSLRSWLNNSFISAAFSGEEKDAIVLTDVSNQPSDGKPEYSLYGSNTQDRVFLLSYYEVKKYFPTDSDRQLENTTYTRTHGAEFGFPFKHGGAHCFWFTRSPGGSADQVVIVNEGGSLNECKSVDDGAMATRPALWLNTDSVAAKKMSFAVGSTIVFGNYGGEPIRWLIVGKQEKSVTLFSERVIDNRQFQIDRTEGITWEKSNLRKWLNNDFIKTAFSADEQTAMFNVKYSLNSKDGVEGYFTISSRELSDPVFLLSYNDVKKIFPDTDDRRTKTTPYAKKMGAGDICCWWLISPGSDNVSVACIDENGKAASRWATDKRGVRPAIMISPTFGIELPAN